MYLERLRLFAELVKVGSYTKAADSLGVSKAYLSKHMKELERDIGSQLLLRNTRTMRLTASGEVLFEQANKLTSFWQDAKRLLQSSDNSLKGEVRFTAPSGLMSQILMPKLTPLLDDHPEITLIIDTGNQTHNLVSTSYDFAVRITHTPPEDMVAHKLMDYEYICCASPAYIEQHGVPTHPNLLNEFSCITLSYWRKWLFNPDDKAFSVEIEGKYQFSSNDFLKEMALKDMGITRLPSYLIQQEIAQKSLISILEEFTPEKRSLYLLYPQNINRPERIKIILNAIKECFADSQKK